MLARTEKPSSRGNSGLKIAAHSRLRHERLRYAFADRFRIPVELIGRVYHDEENGKKILRADLTVQLEEFDGQEEQFLREHGKMSPDQEQQFLRRYMGSEPT